MTLEEVKQYIRVDDNCEDNFLSQLIEVSEIYIDSCVGTHYKTDSKAVKLATLLQKKLIADMYENRSTEIANNTKQDRIVTSILDFLALAGDTNV
ncbi:TPA: phage gp6-like head-tail connector protein [Clostridium botulinum]|nr:phage gp6-like head-tail connector protein [Clostridium botulinum]HDK7223633.1 phage gp6-like head-tail connector protein [Clostridium botulinum]HDK7271035.1 phage gp6-like head-tail connector protein [Clostridium botulinum]HDK7304391.1 phage gp6-like head-tail connector protein [Clostridium botulinum]